MATMVDSLLDALQSHLTSQAILIPALHAQLGLPPTALTEEFAELHSGLIDCIDKKINNRRREVEEWTSKCQHFEDECIKLAKALGSNAKVVAGTVGEFRKQQVLPKRFEYLTTHQDKLHHLYHTKLEQLSGLSNRINMLMRVVGPEFFSQEVTAPLVTPEVDPTVEAYRDVTPERFSRLEKELLRAKSEIARRLAQLSQTFLQIGWLHEELDIPLPTDSETSPLALSSSLGVHSSTSPVPISATDNPLTLDPFLSASHTTATFTSNITNISNTKGDEVTLASYHSIFCRFVVRLQEASDESLDLDRPGNEAFGVESVEPTVGLLRWAEATKHELEDLKARRENHIQTMYNELDSLWRRLGVSEGEMDAFVEANRGSTQTSVQAYELELERMFELKRESMTVFIANARAEIQNLWDELILGDEERGSFAPFADDEHTEELLTLHETEIQRLKEERRIKAPLLAAIKKYFEICSEEKELAAAASDQSRLLGRGPRDPGRLLREEKMRKRVMKEKPRLEKELMLSIPAWENEYRRTFLINGMSIIEVLTETINAADAGKENRKRDRGGSVPPRGTTPQPGVSLKSGPTSAPHEDVHCLQSVSNKRQRLGNSVNVGLGSNNVAPTYGHDHRSSPHKPFGNKTNTPPRSRAGQPVGALTKSGKAPTSSLPRPVSQPRYARGNGHTQLHVPSHGGGVEALKFGVPRIPSNASSVSTSSTFSIFNNKNVGIRGSHRESFKPRPSVDGPGHDMGVSVNETGGGRQWTGFLGRTLKEEEEY